jgi:hypothetical protein
VSWSSSWRILKVDVTMKWSAAKFVLCRFTEKQNNKHVNLMFCWPCIIIYHNNVTNLIHFHFHYHKHFILS